MDWVQLHLALNHVPVIGSLFVGLLLLHGMLKKSDEVIRLSLWWLVVLMLVSIPIKFTGDFANDAMGEGIEAELVTAHEKAADQATTAIFLAGIAAGVALFKGRGGKPIPHWGPIASLILILISFAMMARTANLGGQIKHPEIRANQSA
ncbi:MAG: hypothetical protein CMO80_03170 [Verrucomicrobiales bacterium]|nr:hypothetical protein [Verrucomicrobiales bacterium]